MLYAKSYLPVNSSKLTFKAFAIFFKVFIVGLSLAPDSVFTSVVSVTSASFVNLSCDRPFSS